MFRYSEIVSLFHPPTIVKELGIVGLSFSLLMSIQQMQKGSNTCRKGWKRQEKVFRYSAIVQLFHPTTILCDTISLYLNTRNYLHYHPFRQGFEPFCICCTHKSKRNVKPTMSNALTIVGWDCVHLQYPHCWLYIRFHIRFPGKDVIACLTAFAAYMA